MYKIVWLLISCLVALSLVLTSCASVTTEEKKLGEEKVVTEEKAAEGEKVVEEKVEKPKYGGVLTTTFYAEPLGFDNVHFATKGNGNIIQNLQNDRLTLADWTMGPAGTNEVDFGVMGWAPEGIFREAGSLATAWEVPDDQTIIFTIRKGVCFQDKPPVNGREMTAEDVVFSIKYSYLNPEQPLAYNVISAPGGQTIDDVYIHPNDPWGVIVKVPQMAWAYLEDLGIKCVDIIPHEAIEQYGNLKDWHNAVGTGAYMVTDYVPGSSLVFVRNPNYWRTNPIGPGKGDQLPYLDGIKLLLIADKSTAIAAFRTGKLDLLGRLGGCSNFSFVYEDYESILKTNPKIKSQVLVGSMPGVGIRLLSTDPLGAPLLNQRVRQALSMAIDREEMIRDYYKGAAACYVAYFPPKSPYYRTPEQMVEVLEKVFDIKPEEAVMIKKMYEYHPDEAKKILAEEGYPNGFRTEVITSPTQVDFLSILAAYWAEVGVDMAIDVRETKVYQNIIDSHQTKAMFYYAPSWISVNPAKWIYLGPGDPTLPFTVSNRNEFSHPILDSYIQQVNALYGKDLVKQNTLLMENEAWVMWMAPYILTPAPHSYGMWQPWLKDFYGSWYVHPGQQLDILYCWIDQDMKKAMGYK